MRTSRRTRRREDEDLQPVGGAPDDRGATSGRDADEGAQGVSTVEDQGAAGEPQAGAGEARPGIAPTDAATGAAATAQTGKRVKKPLYPRLLRLRHIQPNAWQRAALGEGAVGAGVLLAMADLATAWTILALPVAVAAVVKAHDALQGLLDGTAARTAPAEADDASAAAR